MTGHIYTETTVQSAPEAFLAEVPYQVVIVDLEDGRRLTGRILGDAVVIGDAVKLEEERDGVPFFQKQI